ncbi:MAG: inositol monophosphatase [Candidatus Nanopelagicaceae bacterium]|jgi:myo-inositol-1(or 4)-monophosphatase|nr:inositol monophosphatase [Candidatus Nanopelagicaceae bacterium]
MSLAIEVLNLAESIALKAGSLLVNRPSKFDLDEKSGVFDFATQMDHESEKLIVSEILAARPDDGLIGEEGANRDSKSGVTWVIDPIDGTVNYLYDIPGWCISIAAKDKDGGLAGVVYSPATQSLWKAHRGGGAFLNGNLIKCNDPVALNRALVGSGFAYDLEKRKIQAALIARLLPEIRDLRRLGACAVDICHVASGSLDAYFEAGVNEWDYAAAGLIATEAGAMISIDKGIWNGEKNMVIVAGPALHPALSAQIRAGQAY